MQGIVVEDKLRQFIKERCDGQYSLQLLLFLGRHPNARFSQLAVIHALDGGKASVARALQHLVDNRLVLEWTGENGFPFYSLTGVEPLRSSVLELVKLDWWQLQLMLGQI